MLLHRQSLEQAVACFCGRGNFLLNEANTSVSTAKLCAQDMKQSASVDVRTTLSRAARVRRTMQKSSTLHYVFTEERMHGGGKCLVLAAAIDIPAGDTGLGLGLGLQPMPLCYCTGMGYNG